MTSRFRPPTLILWGRRGLVLQPGLDEATHWVRHDEPEAVNAALTAFLRP